MGILDNILMAGADTPSFGIQPGGILNTVNPSATAPGVGIDPGTAPTLYRAAAQQAQPQSRGFLDAISATPGAADGLIAAGAGLLSAPRLREGLAAAFGGFNKAFTDARKLSLEEMRARKPNLTPTGQPGIFLAVYPDGRQETVVVDEAVKAAADLEARKDERQQRQFDNQNIMQDKRLAQLVQVAAMKNGSPKTLASSLQKSEDTDLEAIQGYEGTVNSIRPIAASLQMGPNGEPAKLNLGALRNAYNQSRNFLGKSTPESQAYAELERNVTRIVNESLRLNKGVQTEGDAQRAAKELQAAFAKNDNATMQKALEELEEINTRAAGNKAKVIDNRRTSQRVEPLFGGNTAVTPRTPGVTGGKTSTGVNYTIER